MSCLAATTQDFARASPTEASQGSASVLRISGQFSESLYVLASLYSYKTSSATESHHRYSVLFLASASASRRRMERNLLRALDLTVRTILLREADALAKKRTE